MIDSKDVSVVVQGVVDPINTKKCLKSIRKYLPKSKIILSTWDGSNVNGLDYDIVIFNKDPGGSLCSANDDKILNNVNREIVSTLAGLKVCKTKYVFKIRSDLIIKSNKILKCNLSIFKRNLSYSFFSQRIIVPAIYSRYYTETLNGKFPNLFHPSDWLYFGLKEDLYCLFDIPLTSEPDFSLYFKNRENVRYGYRDSHPNRLWRFPPEAYIFTEYLKKKGINIEDKLDLTDKNIELSRNVMVNNFYMLDQNNIKFKMPKYKIFQPLMPKIDRDGLYSNYRWQLEYHCLVDKFFKPKLTLCLLLTKFFDFLHIKRRMR